MSHYNSAFATGTSGFVGGYFLRHLISVFPQMSVIVGGWSKPTRMPPSAKLEYVYLDLSKPVDVQVAPDIVFHIAGEKHDESKMWDVNLEGTRRLLDWAVHNGTKRFVYVSSVGVYGAPSHAGLIREDSRRTPRNAYEQSKNAAEALVKEQCDRCGMQYVILQPSNVIGLTDDGVYPLLSMMRMVKKGLFTYCDKGEAFLNYVAVEDVADALVVSASEQAANRTFILNSPIQLKSAVDAIADVVGVASPNRRLPTAIGFVAGEAASIITRLTGRALPFNRERFRELTNTTRYVGSGIFNATGFAYSLGIQAAIRRLAHQYLERGLL